MAELASTPVVARDARPRVIDFRAPGLGDRSYVVVAGESALVVDPQRDVDTYLEAIEGARATLEYVVETHVHNDYVSGGLELSRRSGATLVLPRESGASYPHRAVGEGETLDAPDLQVRALRTPGHTPEHTAYVLESAEPDLLFSGGSLLAGSAGRTDLAGPAWTDRLTTAQFSSIRRLAAMAPETVLYPTHGAGSFCMTGESRTRGFTTVGAERQSNPALKDADPLEFAHRQLQGLLRYPAYYAQMAPINRAGPRPLGTVIEPPVLAPGELASLAAAGVAVVDIRSRAAFAAGHVPGSLNIELDDSFAAYAGWLLAFDAPLALVVDRRADALEATRQLARIGFERVRGALIGIERWVAEDRPLQAHRLASVAELRSAIASNAPPLVLDVRQPAEWESGVLPGSVLRFVADLGDPREWLTDDREIWTICKSGYRASMAASILAAAGYRVVTVEGGVRDALRADRR